MLSWISTMTQTQDLWPTLKKSRRLSPKSANSRLIPTLQGDKALHPAVRTTTKFTRNCLNKYWFNADDSDVYRI
jgi:hypothetical protein